MADRPLKKIEAKDAAEVCRRFELSEKAAGVPVEGVSPAAYVENLASAALWADAETFLAYALPKREAVWWACLCTREAVGPEPKPLVASALKAAEAWVVNPTDPNRRQAKAAADAVGLGHPSGAAGAAVFASGGSLAPADLPEVPPGEHHAALAVACAAKMAATIGEDGLTDQRQRRLIDLGLGVAEGRLTWPEK